ncbi:MAG: nucleotidyltransferase domain-containing protein [Deltaproteobacteria bacterium]|nr:nucleotidyltransferase domain-containing protein [Deltaproteobacteria bacterium]
MNQEKFDFSIWERNLARKAEESEKLRQTMLVRLDEALKVLSEKYHWHKAFIFGSVTCKGAFHDSSDVDVGIEGLNPLDHYALVADISSLLERDVDVVLLEECGFAEKIRKKGQKWSMKIE